MKRKYEFPVVKVQFFEFPDPITSDSEEALSSLLGCGEDAEEW